MKIIKVQSVILVSISCFLLMSCTHPQKKSDERVIKIGAVLPLSGSLSIMGEVEKKAMDLAIENVNMEKKRFEIYYEDSKSNANGAIAAVNKLLSINQVDVVLSSTTGASLSIQPIVNEKRLNLMAFCMDPDISSSSEYTIRPYIGIDEEADGIISYFKDPHYSGGDVGILYGRVPVWEKVVNNRIIPSLEEEGIALKFRDSYEITEKNYLSYVLKIKESGIKSLILLGYGFEYTNLFKSLVEQKVLTNIQIIGGWGFLYTPVDKELLEGVLVSGPEYVFSNIDKAKDFSEKYIQRYNATPNFDAAFAYNAITLLGKRIDTVNVSDPFTTLFTSNKQYEGVVGNYTFDPEGAMIVETGLGEIKNGIIVRRKVNE